MKQHGANRQQEQATATFFYIQGRPVRVKHVNASWSKLGGGNKSKRELGENT